MRTYALFSLILLPGISAFPLVARSHDLSSTNGPFPIHSSCNATLRHQLHHALTETVQLAQLAKQYLLQYGDNSELATKYFGGYPTAEPIGWYDRIVAADRGDMLFRCDDPDENCATQDGWAGHYRGANATQETVICPLSFQPGKRLHLDAVCGWGHTIVGSPLNMFWAVDLLHRILHVPKITNEAVDHFADGYNDVMQLAKEMPQYSVRDSETLQLFALDVWAREVAAPGVGCLGEVPEDEAAPTIGQNSTIFFNHTYTVDDIPTMADDTPTVADIPTIIFNQTYTVPTIVDDIPTAETPAVVAGSPAVVAGSPAVVAGSPDVAEPMPTAAVLVDKHCHTHADGVVHCE